MQAYLYYNSLAASSNDYLASVTRGGREFKPQSCHILSKRLFCSRAEKKVSEYDQEIPQSHKADQPTAL